MKLFVTILNKQKWLNIGVKSSILDMIEYLDLTLVMAWNLKILKHNASKNTPKTLAQKNILNILNSKVSHF